MTKLAKLGNIEEFYFLIGILNPKEIEKFILHYKKKHHEIDEKHKVIDAILLRSKNMKELMESTREALAKSLEMEYENIKMKISGLRKKGVEMNIEGLKIMNIPQKIKMFEATFEKKDYYKVKQIMHEVENLILEKKPQEENKK